MNDTKQAIAPPPPSAKELNEQIAARREALEAENKRDREVIESMRARIKLREEELAMLPRAPVRRVRKVKP